MKGLLLKDFYNIWAHLRAFLLLSLVFIAGAAVDRDNVFFLYYPCILPGMIAMNLMAYDENEGWDGFCATLPCTAGMLVSCKYLINLLVSLAILSLTLLSQSLAMALTSGVQLQALLMLGACLLPLNLINAALLLPFLYRFGSKKGRTAYYLILGAFLGLITLVNTGGLAIPREFPMAMLLPLGIGVYSLSWWLSVRFYKTRIRG